MMFFVHCLNALTYVLSRRYGVMFFVAAAALGLLYLAGLMINGKGAARNDY